MSATRTYCRYCNKALKGRSDKEFCDDSCRNAFNNEVKKEEHKEIRSVDLTLKKNRRILKDLLASNKTRTVTEKQLLVKGFQFKYHTHFFKTRSGDEYCFCYDYGYLLRKEDKYMIVKELPQIKDESD